MLVTKRSTSFRDPSKPFIDTKNSWESFNALPTPEVKKLMRPNIVKMDQLAVSRIMERIKNEELLNSMQRMYQQDQRQDLRDKVSQNYKILHKNNILFQLKKRHDYQIELLKKTGLKNQLK